MILLSFDTEEFDVPKEHGVEFSLEEGINVSAEGTCRILDILKKTGAKATFFCTANFVRMAPEVMRRILEEGHEVACHGVDHWSPRESDVIKSKQIIEAVLKLELFGYRQPRMFPVNDSELKKGGYTYNSSLNPAFIPGRYMHLTTPRRCFMKDGILQIPASVTPLLRIPLFWLSFHNFPEWLYHALVKLVLNNTKYFVTYFHPWEFVELNEHPEWRIPFIIRNHSGQQMCERLERLIGRLKAEGHQFYLYKNFAEIQLQITDK